MLAALGMCYADKMETAHGRNFEEVIPTSATYWQQPWKWEADGQQAGTASRVFCGSLMDFNDRQADDWRQKLWPIMKHTPHLVWMCLTKIPGRFVETLPRDWGSGYENVWLGASVLHSEDFRRNTRELKAVPAARRFLSMEPLFGPVSNPDFSGIDLVVVGGLSGPKWKAHIMEMEWAVDLHQAAQTQDVRYFFKQVSARKDEQGIDALGLALDGHARCIQEMPDYIYPWAQMRLKGELTK